MAGPAAVARESVAAVAASCFAAAAASAAAHERCQTRMYGPPEVPSCKVRGVSMPLTLELPSVEGSTPAELASCVFDADEATSPAAAADAAVSPAAAAAAACSKGTQNAHVLP
jgi:hypothetical protein